MQAAACPYTRAYAPLVRFGRDPRKSDGKLRERGFDLEFATLIFDGPTLERDDTRRSKDRESGDPARVADPASKLETKALELPPEERARLAERLISSLDHETDPDSEELWSREAERRLAELESGAVDAISAERVIEKARSSLR